MFTTKGHYNGPPKPPPLHPEQLRTKLPKVGETMKRVPEFMRYDDHAKPEPMACQVVYVNRAHLWYSVRFQAGGFRESYKLPEKD